MPGSWILGVSWAAWPLAPLVSIALLADQGELGRFIAALRLSAIGTVANVALAAIWSPRFARGYQTRRFSELWREFRLSRRLSAAIGGAYAVAGLISAEVIYSTLGEEFDGSVGLFRTLLLGQAIFSVVGLTEEFLLFTGRSYVVAKLVSLTTCLSFVILPIFALSFGVEAVAVGFSVLTGLRAVATAHAVHAGNMVLTAGPL